MTKGDVSGAMGKFAEADKDATRGGRIHMMWGEARMLSGRYAEARAQHAAANGMDLSGPDRVSLNVLPGPTSKRPLYGLRATRGTGFHRLGQKTGAGACWPFQPRKWTPRTSGRGGERSPVSPRG